MFDYTIVDLIESGSYGKVYTIRKNGEDDGTLYAGKHIRKTQICNAKSAEHLNAEKEILETLKDGPFFSRLINICEDDDDILIVLELLDIKDMTQLVNKRALTESELKFYASELVVGIDFLHKARIIHRDLKLENIGIDKQGHISIMDFGLSKKFAPYEVPMASSFCGSKQYMAPEVEAAADYDYCADWWSLGVCLYVMVTRKLPFILFDDYPLFFPLGISNSLIDLITKLLKKNKQQRLGGGDQGAEDIKAHPFFSDINWKLVAEKQIQPPDVSWAKMS